MEEHDDEKVVLQHPLHVEKRVKPKPSRFAWMTFLFGMSMGCLTAVMLPILFLVMLVFIGFNGCSEPLEQTLGEGDIKIVRFELEGTISTGDGSLFESASTCPQVMEGIEEIIDDTSVKGILLCINSPGGSVTVSDDFYHLLERFKAKDPSRKVFVLGKDMIASGAYYLSMQADWIRVQPTTVVGSIGVMMQNINYSQLADKIGVQDDSTTSGAMKDFSNPMKPINPEHSQLRQNIVDQMYTRFVSLVARGRSMSYDKAKALADGRLYTAQEACRYQLVDDIGYEDTYLSVMAKQLNCDVDDLQIIYREISKDTWEELMSSAPTLAREVIHETLSTTNTSPKLEYRY